MPRFRTPDVLHPVPPRSRWRSSRVARAAAALLAVPLVAASAGAAPATAADRLTCAGYPETRVFLEAQSWWSESRATTDGESSHAHSGTCFPIYQKISGTLTLDIRSMIHNEPAGTKLTAVRIQAAQKGVSTRTMRSVNPGASCSVPDCTFWTTLSADLSTLERGGTTEFRIHTETTRPDGSKQLATSGWLAHVVNGKPLSGAQAMNVPQIEGRGWYRTANGTELGYENARLRSPVPTAPVCGTWRAKVEFKTGSGGEPITSSMVTVDPNFHAGSRGTVLHEGLGSGTKEVAVDTRALPDGPHKLVIVARANELATDVLAGVQVVPFTVDNSVACSEPAVVSMFPDGVTFSGHSGTGIDSILDAFTPPRTSRVEYWVDGALVRSDGSAPDFDEFWDLNSVLSGRHTLVSKAVVDGRVVESPPVSFTVEK